jgi:hypothetical protein
MLRHWGIALLFLAVAAPAWAQNAPEQLLPASTQVYARWDGFVAHEAAYQKTALGKMLRGDTGKFLTDVITQLQDLSGSVLTVENLLQGVPPEQLQRILADAKQAPQLLGMLGQHGLVIGIDVRSVEPPTGQLTLIVPNAGDRPGPLFGSLHLGASLARVPVKEAKIAGRDVHGFEIGPVRLGWWVEGKHAVVVVGTDPLEDVVKRMHQAKGNVTDHPLYKKVTAFKEFETGARAYVDLAALVALARKRGPGMDKLMTTLGLDGLKSWTFQSGFDGEAERTLSELHMPGPRQGLLRLASGKPFKVSDLPPLPADATSWSVTNFDLSLVYDIGLQAAEAIVGMVSPDDLPKIKEAQQQVDAALGINLRKDLLGSLGERYVQYNSPAEGPLLFGQTFLFRVKDEKKLQASLEQAIKALAKLTGVDIKIQKTTYHGVAVKSVYVRQQGFFVVPTYALHKDWLVVSFFPQAVHGYVLRAAGELPVWEPDAHVRAALDKLPAEFVSISVSDPRPVLRQLLSLAPIAGGAIKSFVPDSKFNVGSIPNAHEATRHLFPNLSVVSDDGTTLRSETRASLALPVEVGILDAYGIAALFGLAVRL